MNTTHPLLRALAHALIGITLGVTTWLIAASVDVAFSGRAEPGWPARQPCPCNAKRNPALEAAAPAHPLPLTGTTS
jgi:hypothetical protein